MGAAVATMERMMQLSHTAAQALMVAAQGLHRRPERAATKADILETIRRMNVLQIDTIHVVARSPYLVLWSRLGDYPPIWLTDLLAEGALFEYWAHEACFLPIEDFALYRHRMLGAEEMGWRYAREWAAQHHDAIDQMLAHVRDNGPVRSSDFERTDGSDGKWWGWKTEKRVLETLLTAELTTLLSPFDPLVWDRTRALAMFGFDYRIECYTPAPKRRYGYFTLPILWRGKLVGRLDPKAHRKEGRLEIKALHLEPGIPVTSELVADVAGTLREFADWHATPTVEVRLSDPPKLAALVQRAVDRAAAPAKDAKRD